MFEHDKSAIKKHTPKLTQEEQEQGYAYLYLGCKAGREESDLVIYVEFEPTTHEVTFIETKGSTPEKSHVWVTEDHIEELEQSKIRLQNAIMKVVEDSKYD